MKKHKLIIIAILAMTAMLAFTCACGVGNDVKDNQISGETSLPSNSENSTGNGESSDSENSSGNENGSDSGNSSGNENGSDSGNSSGNEDGSSGGDIDLPFVPFCN